MLQGSAKFRGPGGVIMDATAVEFSQQITFNDGTPRKSSGFVIYAAPEEGSTSSIRLMSFGAGRLGSLDGVPTDTYAFEVHAGYYYDFVHDEQSAGASVLFGKEVHAVPADAGFVTISTVSYFPDVYQCDLTHKSKEITWEVCEYQLGVITGEIEFHVPATNSWTELTQEKTLFQLPIMRRRFVAIAPWKFNLGPASE